MAVRSSRETVEAVLADMKSALPKVSFILSGVTKISAHFLGLA